MLELLKKQANQTFTLNGAVTNLSSLNDCLDLFYIAGASRNCTEEAVENAVVRAYVENSELALRTIFFARDVRGGMGERRFFRLAVKALAKHDPEQVCRLVPLIAEYGRYDDMLALLRTECCGSVVAEVAEQLAADEAAMSSGRPVSLLAKWLPSANASAEMTRRNGRYLARKLGLTEAVYRKKLTALRKHIGIIEDKLRTRDYTFDYEKQTAGSMLKYRNAFITNDRERYMMYLEEVKNGSKKLHTDVLYPYEIVRRCFDSRLRTNKCDRKALDVTWRKLPIYGDGCENALAVVDGSGSMTWSSFGKVRPLDVAISLGIYFAEHNKGAFGGHFITFSRRPRLVEVKEKDIYDKVRYVSQYNECANTNIEATFHLLLKTAVENGLKQQDMPQKLYIISDMEFDVCAEGGNSKSMFDAMKALYAKNGYKLPEIVFWNVNALTRNVPVTVNDTGCALVSGFTPKLFDIVTGSDLEPMNIMLKAVMNERYDPVGEAVC